MPRNGAHADAVIVGGGHNGLVAACYLARAGRSVTLLERLDHVGGASVSQRPFEGVDARLSRYSYLVSLLPAQIVEELGLPLQLRRRRYASYTPVPGTDTGILIDNEDDARTREALRAASGDAGAFDAWQDFYGMTGRARQAARPDPARAAAHARRAARGARRRRGLGGALRAAARASRWSARSPTTSCAASSSPTR